MDCSTPGFTVHNQLPELAQTHVHQVSDAIQPSHPLSSPSPPAFNLFQHHSLFQQVSSSHQVARVLEFQLQHQSFQWIFRTDFLYDWPVWSLAVIHPIYNSLCMSAKLLQSCPTLCNPMDYSPPGSSVLGILQARILEWVALIPWSPGDLPDLGIEPSSPVSPGLQVSSLPLSHWGNPYQWLGNYKRF